MISSLIVIGCVGAAGFLLLFKGLKEAAWLSLAGALRIVLATAATGAFVVLARDVLLEALGWKGPASALEAAFLITSPSEQATIALVVWPQVRGHKLLRMGTSVLVVALAGLGLAVARSVMAVVSVGASLEPVAAITAAVVLVSSAAGWGALLTVSRPGLRRWLPLGWFGAVLLNGSVHWLSSSRAGWATAVLVAVLAVVVVVATLTARNLRGVRESMVWTEAHLRELLPNSARFERVRQAFQHAHRPALLHWILGAAVVSFGASVAGLLLSVLVAHRVGIDLSEVGASDTSARIAILLLTGGAITSFLVSGYVVARASRADSLFESGLGMAATIACLIVLAFMLSPATGVLALVASPVAFVLGCTGAWLGIERPRRAR